MLATSGLFIAMARLASILIRKSTELERKLDSVRQLFVVFERAQVVQNGVEGNRFQIKGVIWNGPWLFMMRQPVKET